MKTLVTGKWQTVPFGAARELKLGNSAPIGRAVAGKELATIADYRERLNQYRTDPSLVFAHQKAPWITVW